MSPYAIYQLFRPALQVITRFFSGNLAKCNCMQINSEIFYEFLRKMQKRRIFNEYHYRLSLIQYTLYLYAWDTKGVIIVVLL